MIGIGVAGIIVSVTSVIVGQSLIRQVETSVDDSLRLTSEALSAVADSIRVTDSIVDTIRVGMTGVQSTMVTIESSLAEASTAVADSGEFLGGSLPEALEAVNEVLPTIESIASSVDSALRVLERAPFGPDYDPVQPFDEAIADLSSAIEPLPAQLRTLSVDFDGLNDATNSVAAQVVALAQDIAMLDTQLGDVSTLLDRYARTAAQAELLAVSSRRDLADSAGSTRMLLILLGTVFALGQIVPIWLGSVLLTDGKAEQVITV